jgi:hypothetical protein
MFTGVLEKPPDIIRFFSYLLIFMSISFGAIYFKANHDWNRRHAATLASYEVNQNLDEPVKKLNDIFSFSELRTTDVISLDKIHEEICKKDDKGKPMAGKDGAFCIDYEKGGYENYKAIGSLLNEYEYLCVGIRNRVFDEEIIKDLFEGMMIKAYYNFRDYIEHKNNHISKERKGKIWEHFVSHAKRYGEASITTSESRTPTA